MSTQRTLAKRTSIINLSEYVDETINVKFVGGREITGTLKGADPVCNLVLDDSYEYYRDPTTEQIDYTLKRYLGIMIARGQTVLSISKSATNEEILV